jgi:transcriptional regulator with XRE-family HTH domain
MASHDPVDELRRFRLALEDLMRQRGVTQAQLARHIGVTQGTISKILSGKVMPQMDKQARIASHFGMSLRDLYEYAGGMAVRERMKDHPLSAETFDELKSYFEGLRVEGEDREFALRPEFSPSGEIIGLAVYEDAFATIPVVPLSALLFPGPIPADQVMSRLSFKKDWLRSKGDMDSFRAVKAEDDRMAPTIPDNAVVLVDTSRTGISGDRVFVIRLEGRAMIRRLREIGGAPHIITDVNGEATPIPPRADFAILARCLWVASELE